MDLSAQQQQLLTQLDNSTSIGQTVIDQMIDEELIRQEAAARGISAAPQDVEQEIQAAYQYYPLGSPTPTVTPAPVAAPTLSPETLALVTITPTATMLATPSCPADLNAGSIELAHRVTASPSYPDRGTNHHAGPHFHPTHAAGL